MFTSIAIEIASKCNRTCSFCPNSLEDRPDEYMSMQNITNLLKQLADLNYHGRIEFYIYNEPTRDPRLETILALARRLVPRACLMIATNGDYFTGARDIKKLFDAGLNQMQINVYSNAERAEQLRAMVPWHYEDKDLYSHTKGKRCKVVPRYDPSGFEGNFSLINRSGLVGEPKYLAKMCTKPFRFFNINWNGDALICCNDYYASHSLGNAFTTPLLALWDSELMRAYRTKLLAKDRHMPLCEGCDFGGGAYTHNVPKETGLTLAEAQGVLDAV